MAQFVINSMLPPHRALKAQDWEEQRPRIQQLYSTDDRPLDEVIQVMEEQYSFQATKRQYKRKISQWKLEKNIKGEEMEFMVHKQKKRKAEGKDTSFVVRGRLVEPAKIERTIKRKNISENNLPSPAAAAPSDIVYYTPSGGSPPTPDVSHGIEPPAASPVPFPSPHAYPEAGSPWSAFPFRSLTPFPNVAASPAASTRSFSTFTGQSPAPPPSRSISPEPLGSGFSMFAGQSPAPIPDSPAYFQQVSSPWGTTGGLFQSRLSDFGATIAPSNMYVNQQLLEDRDWLGPGLPNNSLNYDDSGTSWVAEDLAATHQGGYLSEEEQQRRRALNDKEKALGFGHPETLTCMDSLADVLMDQGRYKAAEEMHRRALAARENVLGKEHPNTLTSLSSLGWVLGSQGRYKAAEEMLQRALTARENVLGKEHPDTLTSLSHLGVVLGSQGRYKAAEDMLRRALAARENVLGKEHPVTLSLSLLGWVLGNQGRYKAAEDMLRRALAARENVLGKEHPATLTSLSLLGWVLGSQGRYKAAEDMLRRALAARENVLGKEHPDTLISVGNLHAVIAAQDRHEVAEEII